MKAIVQAGESWHAGLPALPGGVAPWRTPALREPVVPVRPAMPREPFHAGLPAPVVPPWRVRRGDTLIDADLVPLVRRYVLEHEQRQQQKRRLTLHVAPGGVDLGSLTIPGVEVAR